MKAPSISWEAQGCLETRMILFQSSSPSLLCLPLAAPSFLFILLVVVRVTAGLPRAALAAALTLRLILRFWLYGGNVSGLCCKRSPRHQQRRPSPLYAEAFLGPREFGFPAPGSELKLQLHLTHPNPRCQLRLQKHERTYTCHLHSTHI